MIFFELVVGETPFSGESPREVFENILNYREVMKNNYEELPENTFDPSSRDIIDQ